MPSQSIENQLARAAACFKRLPVEQWSVYERVITAARNRGLRFAIGGGFGTMIYSGCWRETKDIDLFILERDREEMIRIVTDASLADYYDVQPYERHWIYRSHKGDVIVDLIWAMANRRAVVDEAWLDGPKIQIEGLRVALVRPEETLWNKLYVLQRDRSDWPDGFNLLYAIGPDLDWRRLLGRVGDDAPLLAGLLSAFAWLSPGRARDLPSWLWDELRLHLAAREGQLAPAPDRASLLDSRPWFHPGSYTSSHAPEEGS